jgi:hypothetical protein
MGAVLEAGKQVAAAWLTEHWTSAPSLLRLIPLTLIGIDPASLMGMDPLCGMVGVGAAR